ncbi:DMT family transporter [uncultured Hoeflea sp.]|uniref:DMT family transporter n=1 Tax=uncultured Hoeflea sp. TaxID=538666 RepID=UPI0030D855DE|tara:strand:- start:102 stop:1037 length:936 start_codon:yes stop_codon:yes gene_type:complete
MHKASFIDILLWLALAAMWSSSYAVIKVGVATLEPSVLVLGRLLIGTLIVYGVMRWRGQTLSRQPAVWLSYVVTGLLGSAVPFLLISHGEQSVDSALASILMGAAPVITMLLAAWLVPQEPWSWRTVLGVTGGLTGVAVLVGPTALAGLGAQLGGQLAILAATLCYATSTIYIRRFVTRPPLEMAAGSMLAGTLFMGCSVAASGADLSRITATGPSLGAIVYLGLFSTALANLLYFHLVPRLGATRMSQVNFAVPVGGTVLGVVLLGEALTQQRLIALAIIILSIYLGTSKPERPVTARENRPPKDRHPRP